jgi:hypothetical protein
VKNVQRASVGKTQTNRSRHREDDDDTEMDLQEVALDGMG